MNDNLEELLADEPAVVLPMQPVLDPEFGKDENFKDVDPGFGVEHPDSDPNIDNIDPGFTVEEDKQEELDPGFNVDKVPDSNDLEDFLDSEDIAYNETTTIGQDVDYKIPSELKSNYRVGCAGTEQIIGRIMSNVTGYKIIGNYFNQRTDRHDSTSPIAKDMGGEAQAYDLILNAVISFSDPLNDYKLEDVTMKGYVYFGITPRINDYFSFTDSNGKLLFFLAKEIERVNFGSREIFEVTFNYSFDEITSKDKIQDLMSKVVDTYTYDHDAKLLGEVSLLKTEDYANKVDLNNELKRMKDWFFFLFLDANGLFNLYGKERRIGTETIPEGFYYDKFLVNFFHSLCEFNDLKNIFQSYLPQYHTDNLLPCLFTELQSSFPSSSVDLHPYYGPDSFKDYYVDPFLGNILSYGEGSKLVTVSHDTDDFRPYPYIELLMARPNERTGEFYPLDLKEYSDKSYVFSKNFYNGEIAKMNPFEKMVSNALKKQYPNYRDILPYLKTYRRWSIYESYYCIPILIYLGKKVSKNISSV